MNVINAGNNYKIYGSDIITLDKLPSYTYRVAFDPFQGFSLIATDELVVNNSKIYGDSENKVDKVIKTFKSFNKNMGVILSGEKGCGKSLFARLLSIKLIKEDIPTIIVSKYIDGIETFISSIKQECLILFDEFDKTFNENNGCDTSDGSEPIKKQERLLSLLDGIDSGKKLFVITCNKVDFLNDYFISRPGRFHYHIKITNPDRESIRNYLKDNLINYSDDIYNEIIRLSKLCTITYDILRAIVIELNNGYSLSESIKDLNIAMITRASVIFTIYFRDGSKAESRSYYLDLSSPDYYAAVLLHSNKGYGINMYFDEQDITIGPEGFCIDKNKITLAKDHLEDDSENNISVEAIERIDINKLEKPTFNYLI